VVAKIRGIHPGRHVAPHRRRALIPFLTLGLAVTFASADYTVEPGDTLGRIARHLDVSVTDLAAANGITDPDVIRPGQVLVIPGRSEQVHVVAPGDTLAEIAAKYGLDVSTLADLNGITNPSLIYSGTTLRLGGAGPVAVEVNVAPLEGVATTAVHVVSAGDNLAELAARYGTSVGDLAAANGISNPNLIRIGQHLSVPEGGGGAWICPVADATYFNDWGFPRAGGRIHVGNDLFAPLGTPVRAPVGGWLEVLTGPVGGLQFRLFGDDSNTYIGTHLDTAIGSGPVASGQQIGTVGTSGNAAGANPHLHFEILPGDGDPVNPYPTLQAAGC